MRAGDVGPKDEPQRLSRDIPSPTDRLRFLKRTRSTARIVALSAALLAPASAARADSPSASLDSSAPAPQAPRQPARSAAPATDNPLEIKSADGKSSVALTGQVDFDVGDYLDYHPDSRFATVQDLRSGVDLRRARIGVTGDFLGDWRYAFVAALERMPRIENAYVSYRGLDKPEVPLIFDVGYLKTRFTLDGTTRSRDILFLERPSIVNVVNSIAGGNFRSAFGLRSNDTRYWAGVYLTGPAAPAQHVPNWQLGVLGRATYQFVEKPGYSLHFGVDLESLVEPPTSSGIPTITLSDRPELRIDPTQILSTGALGTAANPFSGATAYGVEAAGSYRNFFAQAEYYRLQIDRQGLPTNDFAGGYVEGSWTLTGEEREYRPSAGAYTRIVAKHPLSREGGGFGAFELAVRYSEIDLNDDFLTSSAAGVGGGRQTVYAIGLNWYPSADFRLMLDYLHGTVSKGFSSAAGGGIAGTPLGAEIGGNFDGVALRAEIVF